MFFHRAHSRQTRAQNVEIVRQFARSARSDRKIWRGWFALRSDADCTERAGHCASTKNKSKKAAISRPSFGMHLGFAKCMVRVTQSRKWKSDRAFDLPIEGSCFASIELLAEVAEALYREYRFNDSRADGYTIFSGANTAIGSSKRAGKTEIFGRLNREARRKQINPGRDGFRPLSDCCACFHPYYATHHGRALVGLWVPRRSAERIKVGSTINLPSGRNLRRRFQQALRRGFQKRGKSATKIYETVIGWTKSASRRHESPQTRKRRFVLHPDESMRSHEAEMPTIIVCLMRKRWTSSKNYRTGKRAYRLR